MEEKTIEIPLDEYNEMLEQLSWLEALQAAGVDNWDGIDEAVSIYEDGQ